MKRLRDLLFGVIALAVIAPVTLAGCSKTTEVEENVVIQDENKSLDTAQPQDDVNVNVEVEGNTTPPQPVIIEKKEIIHETNNITRVEPVTQPEKKVEVHTNVTNVNPPADTGNTEEPVVTTTTTTTESQ